MLLVFGVCFFLGVGCLLLVFDVLVMVVGEELVVLFWFSRVMWIFFVVMLLSMRLLFFLKLVSFSLLIFIVVVSRVSLIFVSVKYLILIGSGNLIWLFVGVLLEELGVFDCCVSVVFFSVILLIYILGLNK